MRTEGRLFVGLISGTSADAIDAAVVDFAPDGVQLIAATATPYAPGLRRQLLALAQGQGQTSLDELGLLDAQVALGFAEAANAAIRAAGLQSRDITAIGSHGQTIWHRPGGAHPFTLQIGDPARIAEASGCTVVADFRRRDMAAGGQGAPLMPAFHAALVAARDNARAVLNLGGIANLTLLPADPMQPVRGFDTGPASCLLDAWTLRHRGEAFDRDGAFAAQGRCHAPLLAAMLDDPYFALPAPKSTGREVFNLAWMEPILAGHDCPPADVQATLVELTARSVTDALRREAPATQDVFACGGGVHNPRLMQALSRHLAPARLASTATLGIDPDYVEAMGFAWLARETLAGRPGNIPAVTGACGPRILGGIYPA